MDNRSIFQVDSIHVRQVYNSDQNIIEETFSNGTHAVVFFSSHGIYFPNDYATFRREIVEMNRFEWQNSKNRICFAKKNIFLRDVFKQWYVKGISDKFDSVDKVCDLLQKKIGDKSKLITIGSSAGGYAAALFGALLKAEYVLCFSGQFTLWPILRQSNSGANPLIFHFRDDPAVNKYYNLEPLLKRSAVPVYYFMSSKSLGDGEHIQIAKGIPSVRIFEFSGNRHGIPFPAFVLTGLLNKTKEQLDELHAIYKGKLIRDSQFSINVSGLRGYIAGSINAGWRRARKLLLK